MANYFVKSGTGGADTGADWANAAESIAGLLAVQTIAGGDTIYCHNTHANNAGAAITWTLPESGTGLVRVLSVDGGDATGASLSGTTVGNLYAGASESTNANSELNINTQSVGNVYFYGMTITAGGSGVTGSGAYIYLMGTSAHGRYTFENCTLYNYTTYNGPRLFFPTLATTDPGAELNFINCTFKFNSTGGGIYVQTGRANFENCAITDPDANTTTITTFLQLQDYGKSIIRCVGCDWTIATNVVNQGGKGIHYVLMSNCVIGTPVTGTHQGVAQVVSEFHACGPVDGTNGPDLLNYYYEDVSGVVEDDQSIYVTSSPAQGKQDDGTLTSYSFKMTPSANATAVTPLYTPWFYAYVGSTGSKTVSVKAADTEAAVLKDTELWLEVEYVGGAQVADSPQSQRAISAPVVSGTLSRDVVVSGSNLTDTGEAWTGIAETGTYTLSSTVTVDEYGYIRCRVGLAKDTTNPVYVDPKITVA